MAAENEQSLKWLIAVRRANRGVLTRHLGNTSISNESNECERLKTLSGLIEAKGKLLESLDEKLLAQVKIEDIETEVEDSSLIAEKIAVRRKINSRGEA